MSRLFVVATVIGTLVAAGLPAGTVTAAQNPAAASQPPKGFKAFSDPNERFALFYPNNWQLIAGARNVLLTIARPDLKVVVVIERQEISLPITEISDELRGSEAEILKSNQPKATGVTTAVAKGRPTTLFVDYSRTGIRGQEQVRQYAVFEGLILLRITCIAEAKEFDKQAVNFETIANSVKIPARQAGGSPVEQR